MKRLSILLCAIKHTDRVLDVAPMRMLRHSSQLAEMRAFQLHHSLSLIN